MKLLHVSNNSEEHEQPLRWNKSQTQSFPPAPGHACDRALVQKGEVLLAGRSASKSIRTRKNPNREDRYSALKAAVLLSLLDLVPYISLGVLKPA